MGKGSLKAPLGGTSHPCLDKVSKNADNLVDCPQFSDYRKWVKNQAKGVIEFIKKHVPMGQLNYTRRYENDFENKTEDKLGK
ncbi:hypothetical protein J7M02_06690 [Candidatus Aerophobetes bacterium]|nr:hypothetical protein [Candidatus Aerophobetes bacterium]